MGIATRVAVRLMPDPPAVATMLCAFDSIDAAAATVTGTIAGGVLPAALEMMDARITAAVEDFVGAGYPRDAQAVLLVEVDGLDGGVAAQVEAVREIATRQRRGERAHRGRRRRARAALEGPQVGVRRDRAHRPRLLPARRGGAAHAARRGAAARLRDRRRRTSSSP